MLVLLKAETNTVLKEKYCKKNSIKFFYFSYYKIVFILLAKIVTEHVIVTSINVKI